MPKYPEPQQGVSISPEVGGKVAPAGVWEHPESGERAITLEDPLFGNAQSQAFKRLGFVFVRPAEPEEVKTLPQLAIDSRKVEEGNLKGLSARLDRLEGVAEKNVELEEEVAQLRKEKEERNAADAAAASAAKSAATAPKPASEKSLSKLNATDLKALAEAEGVEITPALDTNKKIRTAIQAARDQKESN